MDNTVNEGEVHQSFHSPPRRRRSTFFERRDSVVPQYLSENVHPNVCIKTSESDKRNQNLTAYYDKLLAEKEQWKKEVKSRRNKYHDLRQQYKMAVKASSSRSRVSFSALSNEDIEFLKAKPNLSKLVESQQKFHKSVKEIQALYRRANELDDVILTHCEEKENEITEYIFDHSTLDLIE